MRRAYDLPSMRALVSIAAGAIVAVLTFPFLMYLVRDVLHYGCELLVGGEAGEGTWACSDGIGYLLPGLSLVVPIFLAAVAGVVVSFALRNPRARRVSFGVSAIAPLAWAGGWTLLAADQHAGSHPDSFGVWATTVLPSLLVSAVAVAVLTAAPIRSVRVDLAPFVSGAGLLVLAAVLQPGLIPIMAVSGGFAVAATRPSSSALMY